tara:strand:+ start:139 stop:648 length:510 start_codon:yes stop_codon:yes gene_type:complete
MRKCRKCDVELIIGENITSTYLKWSNFRCQSCRNQYDRKHYSQNKDKKEEYNKEYYQENKEELNKKNTKYQTNKYANDVEYKLINNVRNRIYKALKENKTKRSIEYLGCSIKHYKTYLQQQFDEVMTWDNYGTHWEIDHIHPLSKGGSFHYTNTQPLTIKENRRKGAKW